MSYVEHVTLWKNVSHRTQGIKSHLMPQGTMGSKKGSRGTEKKKEKGRENIGCFFS